MIDPNTKIDVNIDVTLEKPTDDNVLLEWAAVDQNLGIDSEVS